MQKNPDNARRRRPRHAVKGALCRTQRGVVLVLVLLIMAALTLMALSYNRTLRVEIELTAQYLHHARARTVAEAGAWLAIAELALPESERRWQGIRNQLSAVYAGGTVTVDVVDAATKMDLNSVRPDLLQALIESTGTSTPKAATLVNQILDWRDRDELVRIDGAEEDAYRVAGRSYGPKNGPFNSIGELQQVLGMTNERFRKLAPYLTLYTYQPGIYGVQRANQSGPGNESKADNSESSQAGQPESQTSDDQIFSQIDLASIHTRQGFVFEITSVGEVEKTRVVIQAFIARHTGRTPPYTLLSWQETDPWTVAGNVALTH